MSGIAGVTVTIMQGTTVVATLTTNSNGQCNTILNQGVYSVTFSAPGKTPVNTGLTLSQAQTQIIFVLPFTAVGGIDVSATQDATPKMTFQIPALTACLSTASSTPNVGFSKLSN